jgi:hypothetical protein
VEEQPTCGRGLAESAAVPAALSAVAAGLAQNLEVHVRALPPGDAAADRERGVYELVSARLRSAADDLRAAAAEMVAAVDLPMGAHDIAAMSTPDVLDAYEEHVTAEDALRRLLEGRREDDEQLLAAIRAEISGPDAGGHPAP